MSTTYPNSFPLSELQSIVSIVRSGNLKGNINQLAFDAWVVQGFAQKSLLGAPDSKRDGEFSLFTSPVEYNAFAAVAAMEAVIASADQPSAQAAVPWDLICVFILELLQDLLN